MEFQESIGSPALFQRFSCCFPVGFCSPSLLNLENLGKQRGADGNPDFSHFFLCFPWICHRSHSVTRWHSWTMWDTVGFFHGKLIFFLLFCHFSQIRREKKNPLFSVPVSVFSNRELIQGFLG